MANEKFKFNVVGSDGKTFTVTENHPKLTASATDKEDACNAVADMVGGTAVSVVLNSDTTVWQAN